MAKQKMDLEQLYHDRFQSFEIEQSPDISLRMQKKIRHYKTLQLFKWIAIGAVIVTTAMVITIFLLYHDEPQAQINTNKHQSIIKHANEKVHSQNQQNANPPVTKTKQKEVTKFFIEDKKCIAENSQKKNSREIHKKGLNKSFKLDELKNTTNEEQVFEDETMKTEVKNQTKTKTPIVQANSFENLEPIEQKIFSLQINTHNHQLGQRNLNLTPKTQFKTTKKNKKTGANNRFDKEISKNKTSIWNAYLDLHLSPLFWQNKAGTVAPDLDTNWTYTLKHQAQLSYEFGISFQLHHENLPVFLQLGLDYQILKEKIDFQLKHTFEDTELSYWTYDSTFDIHQIIDTFYIIIDSNHFIIDTVFTQDTVLSNIDSLYNSTMSTEEKLKSHVNTYTYINIPLLLGYQFQTRNKKWEIQFLAGAAISVNLKNEGYYYTNTGDFNPYSGRVSPSLVWNLYAAASVNYHLQKWQFFMQPEYQYQLNESQYTNQLNKRKYQLFKVKFGIRYQLF